MKSIVTETVHGFHIGNVTFDVVGTARGTLRFLEMVEVGQTVDILCSVTYFPMHHNYTQVCLPNIANENCS